jgi:hypothetical protein
MQIPSGDLAAPRLTGGEGDLEQDVVAATAGTISETIRTPAARSLHPEEQRPSPALAGDEAEPLSQNLDAGVGKPITFQKSWTWSSFELEGWSRIGASTRSSSSARIATSLATEPDSNTSLESSSDRRQENLEPDSRLSEAGESQGCGARVRRR